MPCCIIGESVAAVRVRIKPGWEMDLRKELILALEEYVVGLDNWVNSVGDGQLRMGFRLFPNAR